jgi:hypothetical protein
LNLAVVADPVPATDERVKERYFTRWIGALGKITGDTKGRILAARNQLPGRSLCDAVDTAPAAGRNGMKGRYCFPPTRGAVDARGEA